jgi:hypothetical protein
MSKLHQLTKTRNPTGHEASMNRTEFLQQPEVIGFTDWLAATLPSDRFS